MARGNGWLFKSLVPVTTVCSNLGTSRQPRLRRLWVLEVAVAAAYLDQPPDQLEGVLGPSRPPPSHQAGASYAQVGSRH